MAIVNTHYGFCGQKTAPKFTYTGSYNMRDDGVVELLTSGTIVFLEPTIIDLFMVGGGGAGGSSRTNRPVGIASGGGAGGHTQTHRKVQVTGTYVVTIGAGGDVTAETGASGGATSFGSSLTVAGGKGGLGTSFWDAAIAFAGGAGGSGGGGGTVSNNDGGTGGFDGENGERGGNNGGAGGKGQASTTREFGEVNGKLYAGGGGGGRYMAAQSPITSAGGSGGGGTGAFACNLPEFLQAAAAGVANTGGGGGGGAVYADDPRRLQGASGGSGIVCFRAAK